MTVAAYAMGADKAGGAKRTAAPASALRIGAANDALEREADRAADAAMSGGTMRPQWSLSKANLWPALRRKCDCGGSASGGECEECKHKGDLQRAAASPASQTEGAERAPAIVHDVLRAPGQPLDRRKRDLMEDRFGTDFSQVRVHSDARAAESARAVNALGYTVGAHVVLDPHRRHPDSYDGLKILAHELAHVIQQRRQGEPGPKSTAEIPAVGSTEAPARPGPEFEAAQSAPGEGRSLMRLTPAQFRSSLGATPDEKTAINGLFSQAQFTGLWNYMAACKATPKQDLGPLALKVTPGLKMRGVERFGGYFLGSHTLEINPTKPEHVANPEELVDTIVHELIHAIDDLQASCKRAGSPDAPLGGAATDSSAPSLADVKGKPDEDKLMKDLGPGASNPCAEFIDINKQAQQIVVSLIQSNLKTTKIGHPTITFVNDALRQDPQALADYKACRNSACATANPAARQKEIGQCADMIIMKYVTPLPVAPKGAAVAARGADDRHATRTA